MAVSKALITAGAELETRADIELPLETIRGSTPLHLAAIIGLHEMMVLLIDSGASVASRLHTEETLLYISARYGRLEDVRVLLRAKADPLVYVGVDSPMNVAAHMGYLSVVHELVQQFGIDGCVCDGGTRALEAAAAQKHVHVVAFLCYTGVVDNHGRALCAAVQHRNEAGVKLLLRLQAAHFKNSTRAYVDIEHTHEEYAGPRTPLLLSFNIGRFYSPRMTRLLVDASVDTESVIRFETNEGVIITTTPTEVGAMALDKLHKTKFDRDALDGIRGVMRLLHQVDAVHAVSWLWPTCVDIGRATEDKSKKKSSAIVRMLPLLKRRATKPPRVLLSALSRFVCVMSAGLVHELCFFVLRAMH